MSYKKKYKIKYLHLIRLKGGSARQKEETKEETKEELLKKLTEYLVDDDDDDELNLLHLAQNDHLKSFDKSAILRVTNFSEETSEADLLNLFAQYARVTRVYLALDRDTQQRRGFVHFYAKEDASNAIKNLQDYPFGSYGLHLEIDWVEPSKRNPELQKYEKWKKRYGDDTKTWFEKLKKDIIISQNNNKCNDAYDILKKFKILEKKAKQLILKECNENDDVKKFIQNNEFKDICPHPTDEIGRNFLNQNFCKLCGKIYDKKKWLKEQRVARYDRSLETPRVETTSQYKKWKEEYGGKTDIILNEYEHEHIPAPDWEDDLYASNIMFNLARDILDHETRNSLFNYISSNSENKLDSLQIREFNGLLENKNLFSELDDIQLRHFRDNPNDFILSQIQNDLDTITAEKSKGTD